MSGESLIVVDCQVQSAQAINIPTNAKCELEIRIQTVLGTAALRAGGGRGSKGISPTGRTNEE